MFVSGYIINLVMGQFYVFNLVFRGDYVWVIVEFWVDGLDFEILFGYWFMILNEYVLDYFDFEKRIGGQGEEVGDIEWYVKVYFMLGGVMYDVVVIFWGIKGWYDYLCFVFVIWVMVDRG